MTVITPGPGGVITVSQAAALCGVHPKTVRNWIYRGWHDASGDVVRMPVAWRYRGQLMLDPVEVAKADRATRVKARRAARPEAA